MNKKVSAILMALLAAVLYALSTPFSKILLEYIGPYYMAAFLYLGAGIGIGTLYLLTPKRVKQRQQRLNKGDLPYVVGMIVLDTAAPILLMLGLMRSAAANVSLLNNFEIVPTAVIALVIFKEKVSKKLWGAIALITAAGILLSFQGASALRFSFGSLYVVGACVCWGLENNCTRKISDKSTYQIVILKGIFSGLGAFVVALICGERLPQLRYVIPALLLGFAAYGLSIFVYIRAQSELGAAKTSAYYAAAPFAAAALSLAVLHEPLSGGFIAALAIMLAGTALAVSDTLEASP